MKVKREIEVDVCDVPGCGSNGLTYACLACGVVHCWDHAAPLSEGSRSDPKRDPQGMRYDGNVWGGNKCFGYYCNACDERLARDGSDSLHVAYRHIAFLQEQFKYEDERRQFQVTAAEAEVQREREKRGLR